MAESLVAPVHIRAYRISFPASKRKRVGRLKRTEFIWDNGPGGSAPTLKQLAKLVANHVASTIPATATGEAPKVLIDRAPEHDIEIVDGLTQLNRKLSAKQLVDFYWYLDRYLRQALGKE